MYNNYIFKVIGDIETLLQYTVKETYITSASKLVNDPNASTDYVMTLDNSNLNHFKNKIMVDEKYQPIKANSTNITTGFSHKALLPSGSDPYILNTSSLLNGRPMGITNYFVTASDGTILYPPNHYINAKSSKESLFNIIYGGWKSTDRSVTGSKNSWWDPTGTDTTPDKQVTTINVAGSNTKTGIVAINRGRGLMNNSESGSMGR